MASDNIIPLTSPACAERLAQRRASPCSALFDVLDAVKDPEVPVLSIWDLGVLQDVLRVDDVIEVVITPTYSGCPAMEMIETEIATCLHAAGHTQVRIRVRLAPPWTTDWMAPDARERLRTYGIAPPHTAACPQCGSQHTELVSEFGSTACKALYRCTDCREPFDHFKGI